VQGVLLTEVKAFLGGRL